MKKIIFVLLSAIMLQSSAKAQFFQNSVLPETMIHLTNLGNQNHIHYVTNHSYGNADFKDYPSDLYVATWRNQFSPGQNATQFYYKRSEYNNPVNIIDEGHIAIQDALIRDAVIVRNPNYTKGISGAYEYCVVVAYTKGDEGYIDHYEWTNAGMNLISTQQFAQGSASGSPINVYSVRLAANDLKYYVGIFENNNHQLFTFGGSDQRLIISNTKEILDGPIYRSGQVQLDGLLPDITINKNESVELSPNYDFTDTSHSFYAPTEMKLFLTFISTDETTCYIRTAYLDDVLDNVDGVPTEYVDHIPDYFDVNYYTTNPTHLTKKLTNPPGVGFNFNDEIDDINNVNMPLEGVYHGLTGPLISSPENSISDTWGVIAEQFLMGTFYPFVGNPFFDWLGCLVVTAYQTNVVTPGLNNKRILNVEQGSPNFPSDISNIGIPGGVDMALKDFPVSNPTEVIHHCLPAVAFLDDGNQMVYAWGNTKDIPMLNDHNYIGILLDVAGNPIPGGGGETYRLIDHDPSINPNVRAIALSSNNDNTGDLYMVYAGDINVPTYSECLYQKEAEWWRIQSFGFRPAGIDDNQTVQQFFKVYPSPFQTQFVLSLSDNNSQKEYQMTMTDIFGRVVFKAAGNTVTINKQIQQSTSLLQQLSSGMYLIRLDGDTQSQSIKIIKD